MIAGIILALLAVAGIGWLLLAQPVPGGASHSSVDAGQMRLREDVATLTARYHPRDWRHTGNLDRCADFVAQRFGEAGAVVEYQEFAVQGREYRNVIGRFRAGGSPRIVVGAHYDTYGEMPGADDNASGVAVLLALAELVGAHAPDLAVDLVAYTLEEPPFFGTPHMGSAVHAASLAAGQADCLGVIVLEMVGFFSDEPGSQGYPSPLLRLIYPGRGDFIAVVSRWDQGGWIRAVKAAMQGTTALPVHSLRSPSFVPGIDLSDHMSYWPHGIPSLMVTDTAFYRNPFYHTPDDTPEKLDYRRMAQVAVAVFEAVRTLGTRVR
jgi:hypothetical protein